MLESLGGLITSSALLYMMAGTLTFFTHSDTIPIVPPNAPPH